MPKLRKKTGIDWIDNRNFRKEKDELTEKEKAFGNTDGLIPIREKEKKLIRFVKKLVKT